MLVKYGRGGGDVIDRTHYTKHVVLSINRIIEERSILGGVFQIYRSSNIELRRDPS